MTQKVLQVGSSAGITIPKESLKTLGLKVGDQVVVTLDEKERSISIAPVEPPRTKDEKIAKLTLRFIERYRADLDALSRK